MGKYLLRRILQMIPVVLGTTLLIYALVFALPGDPVKAMFGDKPVNEAVAAQIRAEYNLDKPFVVQYLLFLKNALTLDFGKTFSIDEGGWTPDSVSTLPHRFRMTGPSESSQLCTDSPSGLRQPRFIISLLNASTPRPCAGMTIMPPSPWCAATSSSAAAAASAGSCPP